MAELTKIFTGMGKGPEAIWGNEQALNVDAVAGAKLGTEWMPVTMLNGYTSSNAEYTVIGKLVLFSGNFLTPAESKGAVTEIFKLPFSVNSGQFWMAEAPNGNGGVATPSANLFPMDGTTIGAWHAIGGQTYSLLGVYFTKI